MSIAYQNRKKAIKRLRKEYLIEKVSIVRFYAVPHNDRWCGVAARLALADRGLA